MLNLTFAYMLRLNGFWWRVLLLPAILMWVAYMIGGFYFESNDDPAIILLLSGVTAASPVSDLHLFLIGWSKLLSTFYRLVPQFPWYDTLLTSLMYVGLATAFYVLEVTVTLKKRWLYMITLEVLFFGGAYVYHLLQMNFTRPAILLGAGGMLLLVVPGRAAGIGNWVFSGLFFMAGWGLRPQAAELGALLVMPLLLLRPWRHTVAVVIGLVSLGGGLTLLVQQQESAAGKQYAYINAIRVQAFDYQHYTFTLQTPADSLAYATLSIGKGPYDKNLVNEEFFRRCLRPVESISVLAIWQGLWDVLRATLHNYLVISMTIYLFFIVLLAWRRGELKARDQSVWFFGFYQIFFWVLYLGVASYYHPVPRVTNSMITVYLLCNLIIVQGFFDISLVVQGLHPKWRLLWGGIIVSTALLAAGRAWGMSRGARDIEQKHSAYLAKLYNEARGTTLVDGGLGKVMDNLRLFKSYDFLAYHRILTLGGWSIYDPSQPALRLYLTGQEHTAAALLALGRQPRVVWVLQPAFATIVARYLNFRLHRPPNHQIHLLPFPSRLSDGDGPCRYVFREE